eukprot:TRINITY_DN1504_c0_g1_i1.p1 TRINITY_DN1504_c0_g1~~TRINITY_DN1504_c0_g1_i1.p1  ORF type:complete len:367 (-),score=98.53 TRINITY_DN1504_c0_g1_i1:638-1738(-)
MNAMILCEDIKIQKQPKLSSYVPTPTAATRTRLTRTPSVPSTPKNSPPSSASSSSSSPSSPSLISPVSTPRGRNSSNSSSPPRTPVSSHSKTPPHAPLSSRRTPTPSFIPPPFPFSPAELSSPASSPPPHLRNYSLPPQISPPPAPSSIGDKWVNLLKEKSLEVMESWLKSHGKFYLQLEQAYQYMKNKLKVNVLQSNNDIRYQQQLYQRYTEIKADERSKCDSIIDILQDLEGHFNLLIPNLEAMKAEQNQEQQKHGKEKNSEEKLPNEEVDLQEEDQEYVPTMQEIAQEYGLGNAEYSLSIEINTEELRQMENPSNQLLFDNLRSGGRTLMRRHLPVLKEWIKLLLALDHLSVCFHILHSYPYW